MTWKDDFLILWIFFVVVVSFVVKHFFGGVMYFAGQIAAISFIHSPALSHLLFTVWR
ncbi:MAG TPA: hypothetical protein VJN93_17220 [Candidatus Acidoferrum sp.]|nr:hypothetical protein [Candidatus Acidoferrum sp.]